MKDKNCLSLVIAGVLSLWAPAAPIDAQERPVVQIPQPGV